MIKLRVDLIRDIKELCSGSYAARYGEFAERLEGIHCLVYSVPWLRITSAAVMQEDDCLFFVTVSRGQEIVGVAPFHVERLGWGRLSFRQLHYWGKGSGYTEYPVPTMIALPGYRRQCADIVTDNLKDTYRGEFDEINLTRVDPQDYFIRHLCNAFMMRADTDHGDQLHLFVNEQSIDRRLQGENLRRIRKARERLTHDFENAEFACLTSLDESVLEEIRRLHIRRQKEIMETGRPRISFFEDPVENEVTVKLIRHSQAIGAMRTYTLRLDGKLVSFWICFHCNGYTLAYITACTPVPGHKYATACNWRYMYKEEMERHGARTIDTGVGSHILKVKFCNRVIDLRSIVLQNQYSYGSRIRQSQISVLRRARQWMRACNAGKDRAGTQAADITKH